MAKGTPDWRERMKEAFTAEEPFIGHPLLPIPLKESGARTQRVSAYVELEFLQFMEQYQARGGFRGVSEVLRRLAIIGAQTEGYQFEQPQGDKNERNTDKP
jgi:hypothetical protein